MATDVLRPIPGWEGFYSVTCDGRVWSHERSTHTQGGRRSWTRLGRWLVPVMGTGGYPQVNLYRPGIKRTTKIHRLVALAWLPPATGGRSQINHKDSDRANNHCLNLEWCTPAENVRHGWREGLRTVSLRQQEAFDRVHELKRHFAPAQVEQIKARVANGEVQRQIAFELGVSPATICLIVNNRSYKTNGARHAV